ncbi:MAG: HEAT repeat domain-containing protein, partial [Planctomycetota bacterium]
DEAADKAFETLKTYDWGQDRAGLGAIDAAVAASHNDEAAQKALAARLAAVLGTEVSGASKDFVCRALSLVGSAESVPALAPLLLDEKLSHMGRYALERIPGDEAVAALREAAAKTKGRVKVGLLNSLGVRRDAASVDTLVALLGDSDEEVASAAAAALGAVGNSDAAKALGTFQEKAPESLRLAAADAYLTCAERLLAGGKKAEAMVIYKSLSQSKAKHVRLAAMRGLLAATGKQ